MKYWWQRPALVVKVDGKDNFTTALEGNSEERASLVRDRDDVVATAVLANPGVTIGEVEAFAAMKDVSVEVLREIGSRRRWTKHYSVLANLVRNPHTPISTTKYLVPGLRTSDLEGLAADREVPDVLRRFAWTALQRRLLYRARQLLR